MNKIRKQIEAYEKHPSYVRVTVTGVGTIYFKNDTPIIQGTRITEWRAHEMMECPPLACNRITHIDKLPSYADTNKWYKNEKEIC
jgi:hypothetical protein